MTWTVDSSGSQTATIGTEYTLASPTTNGTYVFVVDTVNMVNGDLLELRLYDSVDGLTFSQLWKGTYQHVQINPGKFAPPFAVTTNAKFTLKQGAGTGRAFPFSLRSQPADVNSTAYTNFIARTIGLDVLHTNAYNALLNGLTTDGLFNSDGTSNFFDALYIFATEDQTTALLNLCGTNFLGINTGVTFTVDSGFTGVATAGDYINTQFNPTTASSPKFTRNSAHLSIWNLSSGALGTPSINDDGITINNIYAKFNDNNFYARINDGSSGGFAITTPTGHLLGNRDSSTTRQAYQNASTTLSGGTVVSYGSVSSVAPANNNIEILGSSIAGSNTRQVAMASIGASLNATQVTNFYNRLRTYMTAVGVP